MNLKEEQSNITYSNKNVLCFTRSSKSICMCVIGERERERGAREEKREERGEIATSFILFRSFLLPAATTTTNNEQTNEQIITTCTHVVVRQGLHVQQTRLTKKTIVISCPI